MTDPLALLFADRLAQAAAARDDIRIARCLADLAADCRAITTPSVDAAAPVVDPPAARRGPAAASTALSAGPHNV